MYGNVSSGVVTGSTLAATGLAAGSMILLAVGGVFLVAGIYILIKKNSKHRP